jgi:release factor glutamine methyltransferase
MLEGARRHAGSLAHALGQARAAGLARQDAQLLLLHALGRNDAHARAWLIAHDADPLPAAVARRFQQACARRAAGEPVAYITGRKAFYGLTLHVDARVLDPRDDTETLVDWALQLFAPGQPWRLLDLGTGSGAVALALARERAPPAQIVATDASADALAVARANARRLRLPVRFLQARAGDWFGALGGQCFDAILGNPPYIAEGDPHLPALRHEPRVALVSGADGLDDLRQIIARAGAHLHPGGWLLLEHGWNQDAAVRALLGAAGFEDVRSRRDLAAQPRCSGGRWPGRQRRSSSALPMTLSDDSAMAAPATTGFR